MATSGDSSAFGDTRRSLLDALEHGEQLLREQAAEIVRRAEERARQVTLEAERRAGELEEHLASTQKALSDARAHLAAARERASIESSNPTPAPARPSEAAAFTPAPVPTPVAAVPVWQPEPVQPAAADANGSESEGSAGDESPRDTLRALRAALEGTD
jgi:hypothetical protein